MPFPPNGGRDKIAAEMCRRNLGNGVKFLFHRSCFRAIFKVTSVLKREKLAHGEGAFFYG